MKRTHCVGVVLFKNNCILLVKHTELARLPTGIYNFPAGRVESEESTKAAAVRELKEETGLTTKEEHLMELPIKKSTMKMKEGTEEFIFEPFLCTSHSGELISSEKTIPEFVDIKALDGMFLIEDVKELTEYCYKTYMQKEQE